MLWVFLTVAMLVTCSCSTVKYVPVETVRTETVKEVELQQDSIYIRDSVYIREKADTVYVTRWRTEYKEALRVDTLRLVQRDSIQNIVSIPAEFTRMQRLKMNVGSGVLWALPILIALYILYRKFLK